MVATTQASPLALAAAIALAEAELGSDLLGFGILAFSHKLMHLGELIEVLLSYPRSPGPSCRPPRRIVGSGRPGDRASAQNDRGSDAPDDDFLVHKFCLMISR